MMDMGSARLGIIIARVEIELLPCHIPLRFLGGRGWSARIRARTAPAAPSCRRSRGGGPSTRASRARRSGRWSARPRERTSTPAARIPERYVEIRRHVAAELDPAIHVACAFGLELQHEVGGFAALPNNVYRTSRFLAGRLHEDGAVLDAPEPRIAIPAGQVFPVEQGHPTVVVRVVE